MNLLPNFIGGRWHTVTGAGTALLDPVLGTELVRVDATGLDLQNDSAVDIEGSIYTLSPAATACSR
jgi:hypothetical protein